LRSDKALFTGKKDTNANAATTAQPSASTGQAAANANAYAGDVDTFPFPITEETVQRGRQRYDIFCSVCHGLTGHGDGMIVRRGYRKAANFHEDRLRQAPVGHFFDVVTNGWGAMPSYAPQIPVQDRWAIIAYVRALQAAEPKSPPTAPGPIGSPTPQPTATGGHQ
jgi:mono/diheme cytochrome c family protein